MNTQLVKSIIVLFLLIPMVSFGNQESQKHEKSKIIKKKFSVTIDAMLTVENKYGNVNITTWNKNSIEIEIKITVKGNDLEDVEDQLDDINIDFYSTSNLVEAKTLIRNRKKSWSFWGRNSSVNYKIDYFVKMPITNKLDVSNDYGSIYLDKLKGKAIINCNYGKIIIGELLHNSNIIDLEYCSKSSISYVKNAEISIDYSKLTVEKSNTIKLNADYSTLYFTDVNILNFNIDYGSIRVENGNEIEGNSDYTTLKFGTISKCLYVSTDYGSLRISNLEKGFDKIEIEAEYTGIKIEVLPDSNFKFRVDLEYASFKYDDTFIEIFKSIEKNSKKFYEGVYGKEKSNSLLLIKSQYGSVTIKEN